MPEFENSVIVLDNIGDKFNKDIASYFTDGRHKIQKFVLSQKPAQIINTAKSNCDTIYITT